jgi:hypothetical protein
VNARWVAPVLMLSWLAGCELRSEAGDYGDTPSAAAAPCSPSSADICNGRDDDCDGEIDELDACADRCAAAALSGSCALRNDGTIWCWTIDGHGAVALLRRDEGNGPFVALAADELPGCALRVDGGVWCRPSQMYDVARPDVSPFGSQPEGTGLRRVKSLGFEGAEVALACARTVDGSLWCGDRRTGIPARLDLPAPVVRLSSRESTTCALLASGDMECLALSPFRGFTDVAAMSVSARHVCALTRAGSPVCAGENTVGQLCDGTLTGRTLARRAHALGDGIEALSVGVTETCVLKPDGVWCCGVPYGTLANIGGGFDGRALVRQASLGTRLRALDVPCGITADGKVICRRLNGHKFPERPMELDPAVFDLCPPGGSP